MLPPVLLAHGVVDNVRVSASLRPIAAITGALTNGQWQVQFFTHTNFVYTLERTMDFNAWTPVSPTLRGTEGFMSLRDTNALPAEAFYRVRAD